LAREICRRRTARWPATPGRRYRACAIKRLCHLALPVLLFTGVAAGILVLRSVIWIPHFIH
jgi:hypothetical protein